MMYEEPARHGLDAERAVATDIYWAMPGPRSFIEKVASKATEHRWLALRIPAFPIQGFATAVDTALRRAHLDNEHACWLRLTDGQDVAAQIGTVFGARALQPSQLANTQGSVRTIVLDPKAESAIRQSQQYLLAFAEALSHIPTRRGQVCLVVVLPEALDAINPPVECMQEMVFSGALTPQEMQAYVAIRMTDRSGPGDTGLLRMLVAEFAGTDAQLAEELIDLPDNTLLGLPNGLEALSSQAEVRWRSGRWAQGCYAELGGKRLRHVLHEVYLARHAGPEQLDATEWLKRRYWRACLRSLLPWLEERRSRVIEVLRGALQAHLRGSGGKAVRTMPSGYRMETSIDDLEYNQIPALCVHDGFRVPDEPRQRLAVDVCFAAKRVRDSMAHMRPPEARTILELTSLMERLLP